MADSTPFQMTDEPLQIFNDEFSASFPSDSCPTPPPMVNHAPMPSVMARQRRCLQPAESSGGTAPNAPSPLAATHAAAAAAAASAASASSATSAAAAHPPPSHKMAPSTSRPKTGTTNTSGAAPHSSTSTSFFSTSSRSSSTSTPLQTVPADRLNSITMAPPSGPRPLTDSIPKKTDGSASSAANLGKQKPPSAGSAALYGKENPHHTLYPAPNPIFSLSFDSEPHELASAAGAVAAGISAPKRVLLDAAPITEDKPATTKKTKADDSAALFPLPSHDSFPHIMDDGTKPSHSYAQLIGMAILRSPNRRLTLSQIYKWISDHYSFYNPTDAGWQNSIRHNLSLHKNFIKIERPKDDPGKGNYWIIEPGTEMQFMREKTTRKASSAAAENVAVMSTRPEPRSTRPLPNPSSTPVSAPCRSPMFGRSQPVLSSSSASSSSSSLPQQQRQHSLPPLPSSSSSQPGMIHNVTGPAELSSDATIPLSDPPGAEAEPPADHHLGLLQLQHADSGSYEPGLFSPIPAAMQSSPPIPRHAEPARHGTPPPSAHLGASGGDCGGGGGAGRASHKRKYPSVDDSGYLSSLESSALRPGQIRSGLLTSEPDRPRIKRGRAEEEIARLRGSSYDSPTKSRGWAAAAGDLAPPSSSPLRNDSQAGQMLPPLTPAVKIKPAIMRPPPSVSPNTTLQMHRDQVSRMLGSPARRYNGGLGEDVIPWSPAFNLDSMAGYGGYGDCAAADPDFSIFQDMDDDPFGIGPGGHGSPVKKSVVAGALPPAKRARLDRSQSTSALSDITGGGGNSRPCRPPMAAAAMSSKFQTPTKMPMQQQQHQILQQQQPPLYSNPAGRLFSPSPSKLSAVMTGDQNWAGLEFGDFLVSEHLAEYQGFDILQGFEKIGSIGAAQQQQQQQQQQPLQHMHSLLPQQQQQNQQPQQQPSANPGGPRAPSKPSLSRSFSTAF